MTWVNKDCGLYFYAIIMIPLFSFSLLVRILCRIYFDSHIAELLCSISFGTLFFPFFLFFVFTLAFY